MGGLERYGRKDLITCKDLRMGGCGLEKFKSVENYWTVPEVLPKIFLFYSKTTSILFLPHQRL